MEKISRILPPSPRMQAVDLRNSGVARPGSPSFGRPVGVSALATPRFDGMSRAVEEFREFKTEREPTHAKDPKVDIVERISRDFFAKAPSAVDREQEAIIDEIVTRYHDENTDLNPLTSSRQLTDELGEEAPVIGGQLDVVA